jgi:hypothetical protein
MYRATQEEVMADLDVLIQPVIDYIKKTWVTGDLLPINHTAYMAQLHADPNHAKVAEFVRESDELCDTFTGLVNEKPGYADCPLHRLISPHYTTYGQYDQGYPPLETFVTALIYWGMDLQKARTHFTSGKDEEDKETAKEKDALMEIARSEFGRLKRDVLTLEDAKADTALKRLEKLATILSLMRSTKLSGFADYMKSSG